MSAKVWVLGDAVVDLLPESDGRLLPCPGGAPANVAVGIARLGGTSGFIGRVSSIAQQSAALAAANANKPSSLQTAISGGTSGAITGAGLASLLGTSTPWGAGIGAGIGLLGSLF